MSEKKRNKRATTPDFNSLKLTENSNSIEVAEVDASFIEKTNFLKKLSGSQKLWVIGIIALLSLGALGSGLKYLEDSAKRQKAINANGLGKQTDGGLLSSVNPFVEPTTPTPTPQLSKEYIYAGSRMLAVEDKNASAVPPADLAVWRQSTGVWHVMGGQGSAPTNVAWGQAGDKTVPGDYDGDGKTDFSVFRPSSSSGTGTWYVSNSSNGYTIELTYGAYNDQTAQADYDGDGKTDRAVFRNQNPNGWWYISRSSDSGTTSQQFGLGSDKPAPADYDGDGKADYAVWRGSNLTFYVQRSSDGQLQSQTLGQTSGDVPVSADYDGDGKADYAIKSGNGWYIWQSTTNSLMTYSWGIASDKEVQNDYDGDGKVDIAVWRENIGWWFIRQSSLNGQLERRNGE